MIDNLTLFDLTDDVVLIFHDTNRPAERELAERIASTLTMNCKHYENFDYCSIVSKRSDI